MSSLIVVAGCLVFLGQGCTTPVTTIRPVLLPAAPQALHQSADDTRLRVASILGVLLPQTGVAAFRQSSIPKQEGALFYGPSFRLTQNEQEYDRKIGEAFVLNVTDPTRDPKTTLREPLQRLLGCAEDTKTFGPRCEIASATSSSVNGLQITSYPVRYGYPSRDGGVRTVTSTAWLIQVPMNEQAWLYILPKDPGDTSATTALEQWVSGLGI